jgi:hypothetical protein
VNFCGAFARTDVMAAGVVQAWEELKPEIPVFFSVHGTGEDEAVDLIRGRLGLEPFERMEDAIGPPSRRRPARVVIVRRDDRVLVQGITGRQGTFWTERMIECGTRVVGGVSPKRAGGTCCGVPVFASAEHAAAGVGFDVAVMFIPPAGALAAAQEAIKAGRSCWSCSRAHTRAGHDGAALARPAARDAGGRPQHGGAGDAGRGLRRHHAGVQPARVQARRVGVVSRSGSLGTLVCLELTRAGSGRARSSGSAATRCSDHDGRGGGRAGRGPAHGGDRGGGRDRRGDGGGRRRAAARLRQAGRGLHRRAGGTTWD